MSCELQVASYELRVESLKARVKTQNCEFKIHELQVQIRELQVQIHGVTSSNSQVTRFKSTSLIIIKSMKTQVISLKSSSFPKIISPKLFDNSWGNSYVQFRVKIYFMFPLLHGYGFRRKLNEQTLTLKEEA